MRHSDVLPLSQGSVDSILLGRNAFMHTRPPIALKPRRPRRRRLNHEAGIKPGTVQSGLSHAALHPLSPHFGFGQRSKRFRVDGRLWRYLAKPGSAKPPEVHGWPRSDSSPSGGVALPMTWDPLHPGGRPMCATAKLCARRSMIAPRPWVAATSSSPTLGLSHATPFALKSPGIERGRVSRKWRIRHPSAISREIPPQSVRLYRWCRWGRLAAGVELQRRLTRIAGLH
jgi:hypothetical protein